MSLFITFVETFGLARKDAVILRSKAIKNCSTATVIRNVHICIWYLREKHCPPVHLHQAEEVRVQFHYDPRMGYIGALCVTLSWSKFCELLRGSIIVEPHGTNRAAWFVVKNHTGFLAAVDGPQRLANIHY